MERELGFSTRQVRAGTDADKSTGAVITPIYQTVGYEFESVEDAVKQFTLEKPGSIYTRLANPTIAALEKRLTALEGGVGTVCFASGMAATLAAVQNLAESGTEIIAMSTIYGGTYTLLFDRLEKRYGIRAIEVDIDDFEALEKAITDKTRCIFIETMGNPLLHIPDIEGVAKLAHKAGLPLIADNTFGTPYLINLKKWGVDFVVHSLTKYIGGHGNTVGGSVTDLGNFSFKGNPRFPEFNEADASYHGLVYADLGQNGFLAKLRAGFLRDTGGCLSPHSAFLLLMGVETLSLRMERHCQNALAAAKWLYAHPNVTFVNYPGVESDPFHARAQKYFEKGAGGVLTFGVLGGLSAARKFIDSLELVSFVAHVSDVRSMVTHPASTTHSQLSEEAMVRCGIAPEMVRFSAGIEDIDDIIADLKQALIQACQ